MSKLLVASALPLVLAAPAIVHMEAYANTLTPFVPTLYDIIDVVSREMVGFIPAVDLNANADRVAVGQLVTWPKSGKFTASDVVVGMQVPEPADRTVGSDSMAITKMRQVGFKFTGEEQKGLNTTIGYNSLRTSEFAQALRTLVNEMETDLANEANLNVSRSVGTAGTTPFATGPDDAAAARQVLDDNGAPLGPRALIVNSSSGLNIRKNPNFVQAQQAGDTMTLRDGELGDMVGFSVHESDPLRNVFVKGTAAGATTNAAGYAIGATVITLASAGTGTIKNGDVMTFAGDTNKYGVKSGDADVSNGGTITLAEPGLRQAIPASATAITIGNSYRPNVGFSQDALRLLARAPAAPEEGDLRIDEYILTDPRSGISFEITVWPGMRMVAYQVALAWGVKASKPENIVGILG